MRQFFTLRFWLAIAGVIGLFLALNVILRGDDTLEEAAAPIEPTVRTVDLVAAVLEQRPRSGFEIVDGVVTGQLDLVLDEHRTMHIYEGTLGEDRCGDATAAPACAVVADLLGDAVVWFTLVRAQPRATIALGPIIDFPRTGWARLENGWELALADDVTRTCSEDTSSLRDFLQRFGAGSTTTVDLVTGRITRVTCAAT